MPPKTNTDKIDELIRTVVALSTRLEAVEEGVKQAGRQENAIRLQLQDHVAKVLGVEKQLPDPKELSEIRQQLAVIKSQVEDLRKDREEWSRRLWQFLPPVAAAIAGVVAGYFLKR